MSSASHPEPEPEPEPEYDVVGITKVIRPPVDLSSLPPTYLLTGHLKPPEYQKLKEKLRQCRCPLREFVRDAAVFIADVGTKRRCELELRKQGLFVVTPEMEVGGKVDVNRVRPFRVVKRAWFEASLKMGTPQKLEAFTLLEGEVVAMSRWERDQAETTSGPPEDAELEKKRKGVMERALADAADVPARKRARFGRQKQAGIDAILSVTKGTPLLRRSTSSFEGKYPSRDLPEWIIKKNTYSCCRSTPQESPNDLFIEQLKVIKKSRVITLDSTGVRAYSTAIAAIKAYPYPLSSGTEVQEIPGCDGKIAALFQEWRDSHDKPEKRTLRAVTELEKSQSYQVLSQFAGIWGVGAETASKFFYEHGYRKLGDIITYHWSNLSRVQQIGVKHYDEFLAPINRREVEKIAEHIKLHAAKVLPGVQSKIVGGYRRGAKECHDVDVLLSHRRAIPPDFLVTLLQSLEEAELVTLTLSVSSAKLRHEDPHRPSKGHFDNLDKALVVWRNHKGGLHRRVDIIIAPAICAGTALLGWSGGTTFQRDLRLFCEKEKGWKFSSDGVWRGNQRVPGTEGWSENETWEDVERRVMETVGVCWRLPNERCTG